MKGINIDNKMKVFLLSFFATVHAFDRDRDASLFDLIRTQSTEQIRFLIGGPTHRRLSTAYINACHNPDLLYKGTESTGRCICDEEYASADRVLCIVEGITCNAAVCTEEHDIWIFDKTSGNLTSRSTCVVCADDEEKCAVYDDTCFNAIFNDQDQMTACHLLLQDTNPVVSCDKCEPCIDQGLLGMQFDCFEGRWNSDGQCISGSRVGHIPVFPKPGDPGFVKTLPPSGNDVKNGDDQGKGGYPPYQRPSSNGTNLQEPNFKFSSGAIICVAIVFGLLFGVCISLLTNNKRTPQVPMQDAVGGKDLSLPQEQVKRANIQQSKSAISNAVNV